MQFVSRSRRFGAAALGVTGLGAAAVTLAAFPTVAQGAVAAVTSVSCSVTGSNWCISGNNGSSGIGVIGTSKSGTGLRGASTSQYGLKATSGSGTAILAQTTSGGSAITANGASGYGLNASSGFIAVYANSTKSGGYGVFGSSSSNGVGIYGTSQTGRAGYFLAGSGDGVYAQSNDVALYGYTPSDDYPLVLSGGGPVVFQVDGNGNVTYRGTLQSFARAAGGGTTRSFSPSSTQPTVEDTGTAQLVRGTGVVRLDPAFVASIEPAAGYRVFVTPDGETHELFVASKTAAGFVVREAQAGRSTVTFDYRIVATKLGANGQHMTILSPAAERALTAPAPRPVVTTATFPAPAGESATP